MRLVGTGVLPVSPPRPRSGTRAGGVPGGAKAIAFAATTHALFGSKVQSIVNAAPADVRQGLQIFNLAGRFTGWPFREHSSSPPDYGPLSLHTHRLDVLHEKY